AIVAPNEAVIASHVQPGRSPNRTDAARKSAKNRRSGRPRFAAVCSPGTGNAYDNVVNTCSWCVTITFVGPLQTEYASTHGMMNATRTTHDAVSKYARNQKATNVTAKSFTTFSAVFQPPTCRAAVSTASARPAGSNLRAVRRASMSHTSTNVAGISTSAMNATSHQFDASHRLACTASYTASAATTISKAVARPTIGRAA